MNKEPAHIDYDLIAKYLAGELSADEKLEMDQWMLESEENRLLVESCRKVFMAPKAKEAPLFDSQAAWRKVASRIALPDKATDDNVIELPREAKVERFPWIKIAAVLTVALAAVLYLFLRPDPLTTIRTAENIREVYLPDSSKVVLNAYSEVSFEHAFGEEHRNLNLHGNAYFDVVSGDLTFSIKTEIGLIEVLGTAFSIAQATDSLSVTVERGRVKVQSIEKPSLQAILERNEKATLTKNLDLQKEAVSSLNDLYWANKRLVYRQATLDAVFREMEDLFGKNIQYDSTAVSNCRLSAVFRGETFESMMDNMAISLNFTYTTSGDVVHVTSNGCEEN